MTGRSKIAACNLVDRLKLHCTHHGTHHGFVVLYFICVSSDQGTNNLLLSRNRYFIGRIGKYSALRYVRSTLGGKSWQSAPFQHCCVDLWEYSYILYFLNILYFSNSRSNTMLFGIHLDLNFSIQNFQSRVEFHSRDATCCL